MAVKPNDMAACQVTPGSEWILAKVLHHDANTGMYKLADEDIESNKSMYLALCVGSCFGTLRKFFGIALFTPLCTLLTLQLFFLSLWIDSVFDLPEQQVQILHPVEKLRAGDVVYAVYPDTTSFYQVGTAVGHQTVLMKTLCRIFDSSVSIILAPGNCCSGSTKTRGRWCLCHGEFSGRFGCLWNHP